MLRRLALVLAVLAPAAGAGADPIEQSGPALRGRYRFIVTGASLTVATGPENGVDCMKRSATATVLAGEVPSRARLVRATLYVSGSLFGNDGVDFTNPNRSIFETGGLRWDQTQDRPSITALARSAADRTVTFSPPGALAPIEVTAPGDQVKVAVEWQPFGAPGGEGGNIGFFAVPIDVTSVIAGAGRGVLDGPYTVGDLEADVCQGLEAICDDQQTCNSEHTKGTASFALLLVVEDPVLPLASVTVFHGMEVMTSPVERTLFPGGAISAPGAGSLAMYVLEGDRNVSGVTTTPPCNADEFVEVDGDLTPSSGGFCLSDDDNPIGNIYNSTINVQPATGPVDPLCNGTPTERREACCGDGLCGEKGVDLDRFDISPALVAGADRVRVRFGTAADFAAIALLTLSVGIYEPVLEVDSQVRVLSATAEGFTRIGGDVEYSIAVSNTGNVDATNVRVFMDGPGPVSGPPGTADNPYADGFRVLRLPPGGRDRSVAAGGIHRNGLLHVEGFAVPAGEIAEIRVRWIGTCRALEQTLGTTAQIGADGVPNFLVAAPEVVVRGPPTPELLSRCPNADPYGPFAPPDPFADRRLRGGGGCGATPVGLLAVLVALGVVLRRRIVVLLALWGCPERHHDPVPEPVPPRHITSLDGQPGETCGDGREVVVTRSDLSRFCIDRFEAALDDGDLGNAHQGTDDTDTRTDGSTTAAALVDLAVAPAAGLSWYQAKAACGNAGKRLCTRAEWERACRGPEEHIYPYGDELDDLACNGFFNYSETNPLPTGSLASCGSVWGVYDLSGNLEEWVADASQRDPESLVLEDRLVRGGSFRSNTNALACFGNEFHAAPGAGDTDRGFRCCRDF